MIKNINIVQSINESNPAGLNNVAVDSVGQITNNFVAHIDCICLDEMTLADRNNLFAIMTQKLCLGGKLFIKIINPFLLANKITKNELSGDKLSNLLATIHSCWYETDCVDIFKQTNMNIESIYYDNIYTIYNLEKK